MTKEQKMVEREYFARLYIPIVERAEDISEEEQIRIALEKFKNRCVKTAWSTPKIQNDSKIYNKCVHFVFSVRIQEPEVLSFKHSEKRNQIKASYFNEFPLEWKLDVVGYKFNGQYHQVS